MAGNHVGSSIAKDLKEMSRIHHGSPNRKESGQLPARFCSCCNEKRNYEVNASSLSDEQEDASSRSRWVIKVQVQESSSKHAPIENGDTASKL
ncbi:hypothetical protein D5086_004435 [Populus alba]|uniref:Uncharacterized protein n=1 Tax=Populus alba TaxID=43335 RepID=A0ACC4CQS4_POPAL